MSKPLLQIRQIELMKALPLRHEVLQFADSTEASVLPGDSASTTTHLGCFCEERLVGVLSLFPESLQQETGYGCRVRAMAVSPHMQRQGIGSALMQEAIKITSARNINYMWCTVRPNAIDFYRRFAFEEMNEKVHMPHGTFTIMISRLASLR